MLVIILTIHVNVPDILGMSAWGLSYAKRNRTILCSEGAKNRTVMHLKDIKALHEGPPRCSNVRYCNSLTAAAVAAVAAVAADAEQGLGVT